MKVTIDVLNNVRCRMTGFTTAIANYLDRELAEEKKGSHWSSRHRRMGGGWDGKRHHFYRRKGAMIATFPKGLLHRVRKLLKRERIKCVVNDHRTLLPKPDMKLIKPDMLKGVSFTGKFDYQLDAVRAAIEKEAGILWLATNAGKSEVATAIIKVLHKLTILYIVPTQALLTQTRNRIAERLGTIPENIGIIGRGQFAPQEITVAIINSVTPKVAKAKRTIARNKILKEYLSQVDCVFLDEGHHAKAKTWVKLMRALSNAQYRYLLSGTPFGTGEDLTVEAQVGPVIARVSNDELVKRGVSAKPIVHMLPISKPKLKSDDNDFDLGWRSVYEQGIVYNELRNEKIAQMAARFAKQKKSTLILVRQLAHGDLIMQQLDVLGVRHVQFVHGKLPPNVIEEAKAEFEARHGSVLVASPIFDEGVDIPDTRGLILADGGKSLRSVLQKIGRGIRRKRSGPNVVEVIDFADMTHKWLAKHALERFEIYEGEGFDVIEEEPRGNATEGEAGDAGADEAGAEDLQALSRATDRRGKVRDALRDSDAIRDATYDDAVSVSQDCLVMRWRWRQAA